MATSTENLLIGAHTSAAGGAHNALLEGHEIGATTIQLFTSNQRRWEGKLLSSLEIEKWHSTLAETELQKIMSHDSYLINLGSPDPALLQKSRKAFCEELERCIALSIDYLNFHPGAALSSDPRDCLDLIAESICELEPLAQNGKTRLLLETTAGQGSTMGYQFDQLAYIIGKVEGRVPIGVCIDTCHIYVAGYDIRTAEGWDATLQQFDKSIGLKNLYAFHVNDSLKGLGSRVDRHQPLGEGSIGWDSFAFLMSDPRTRYLPKYLETPGGPPLWTKEIKRLRGIAAK